jgi:hypothetical protein
MRFNQNRKDGSCEMIFSDKEIETLNKEKKLYFTPEGLKSFGNILMKIVIDFNSNFSPELQKKLNTGEERELDLSKDDSSNK